MITGAQSTNCAGQNGWAAGMHVRVNGSFERKRQQQRGSGLLTMLTAVRPDWIEGWTERPTKAQPTRGDGSAK